MPFRLIQGDCREVMRTLDAESVDAIVTDPPYGLAFMGKGWDYGIPGIEFWLKALRVLKPGGHLLAFSGTRTFHRLTCAIEDAGFEIRDCLMWLYGSGFPKSLDVSKAMDKAAGVEREVVGQGPHASRRPRAEKSAQGMCFADDNHVRPAGHVITAPATDLAREWQGWGTALKPAWEPIVMARKPLIGTVVANVERYGTGAINVDGCRIGTERRTNSGMSSLGVMHDDAWKPGNVQSDVVGRWPANVILGCCGNDPHDPDCAVAMLDAQSGERKAAPCGPNPGSVRGGQYGGFTNGDAPGVRGYTDTGGASRFFLVVEPDNLSRHSETAILPTWENEDQSHNDLTDSTSRARDTFAETLTDACDFNMSLSGSNTADRCLTDTKSTIATETSKTTTSPILSSSTTPRTSDCTRDANCETANGGSPVASAEHSNQSPPNTGTSAERAIRSTGGVDHVISPESLPINNDAGLRFAYVPKASSQERSLGLETPSTHPTVKPLSLMRWLVRLVTPRDGLVLDPFLGSGTTGVACTYEGFDFVGIEQDADYIEIARRRIEHAEALAEDSRKSDSQLPLFSSVAD